MKSTNIAERMSPTPILKMIRQIIGYMSAKKRKEKGMPSQATKRKKMMSVRPKLISEATFLERRNMYFGRLIFVIILEFCMREFIPPLVESLKKEKVRLPEKR